MKKRTGKVQLRVINNSVFWDCSYNCNGDIKVIPNGFNRDLAVNSCIITDNSNCLKYDDYGRITVDNCNIIIVPLSHNTNRDMPLIPDYFDDTDDDSGSSFENAFATARTTTTGYEM